MPENIIRRATLEDLEQVVNLLHQLSPPSERWCLEYLHPLLKCMLNNESYHLNVCQSSNSVIGTSALILMYNLSHGGRPKASIQDVVVDKNSRGLGIGKLLIEDLLKTAKEKNCYKVTLDCLEENIPFYEKCGFHRSNQLEMRIDL